MTPPPAPDDDERPPERGEAGGDPPPERGDVGSGSPPAPVAAEAASPEEERLGFRERSGRFWARHRTLFWALHSVWALATGVVVVLLARERYAFVPWVIGFLCVTWASTLFFGRSAEQELEDEAERRAPGIADEVTGYVTRSLYQETLFFLLPFYAYSTVVSSVNVLFLGLLGGLAVLSCLDLLFDRWLRTRPVFAMIFFAIVAFSAANLILPMLWSVPPRLATPIAAVIGVGSAIPIALRTGVVTRAVVLRMVGAAALLLAVPIGAPALVPPVPLRMQGAAFASDIDRETLALADTLEGRVSRAALGGRLVVVVQVFSPGSVPTTVRLDWTKDGTLIRQSREVEIVAHEWSFRVWDAWPAPGGSVPPGHYRVTLRTATGRIFGVTDLRVE